MKNHLIATTVSLLMAGALSGCNPSDQDQGSGTSIQINGTAVGYLAYSTVFVDANRNGQLDSFETARAVTDKDGYISTGKDSTNYCASNIAAELAKHCLKSDIDVPDGSLLRYIRGYDVATGQPFVGTLTTTLQHTSDGSIQTSIASSLTSLLSEMSDSQQSAFASANGFTVEQLQSDFLSTVYGGGTMDATSSALLEAALQVQKIVDIIADALEDAIPNIMGEYRELPANATIYVYEQLALQLDGYTGTLNDFLNDSVEIDAVINAAISDINTDLANIPEITDAIVNSELPLTLASRVSGTANLVSGTITSGDSIDSVKGVSRTVELMVEQVRNATLSDDLSTDFTNVDIQINDPTFISTIGADGVDLNAISATFDSTTLNTTTVQNNTRTIPYPDMNDTTFTAERNGGLDALNFYFISTGELRSCIKYTSDLNSSYYTDRSYFSGSWQRFDDYTLLATLNVVGIEKSFIIRLRDRTDPPPSYQWNFEIDYDDVMRTWTASTSGTTFDAITTLPNETASCFP